MSAHTIRCLAESKNTSFSITDAITREPLFWWRGNDLRIELALADNGQHLTAANVGSITVAIKPLNAAADDPVSMIETIGSGDCDDSFDGSQWADGSGQLCVAEWTKEDAALDAGEYVLIVSHDDSGGKRNTYLHSRIMVKEDQHDSVSLSAPPTPPANYYTQAESDARYARSINQFSGGDPTGAASSSQAIQDFLNGLGTTPKVVVFPAGSTYLCKNIRIPENTVMLMHGCTFNYGGTSPSGWTGQNGMFFANGTIGTPLKNIALKGGKIVGDRTDNTFGDTDAIQFLYVNHLLIEQMEVTEWRQDGIECKSCVDAVVRNNVLTNINDAALEFRAGRQIRVYENYVENAKDGFMTKPHEAAGGNPETYGYDYHVHHNYFKTRSHGILNNWSNDSIFEYNVIEPQTNGANHLGISTLEHPTVPMGSKTIKNITVRGNEYYGDTTSTFIRQILPNDIVTVERCYYIGNKIHGSCDRGLDLRGIVDVIGNEIGTITAASNAYSLFLHEVSGDCRIEGNTFIDQFYIDANDHKVEVIENELEHVDANNAYIVAKRNRFVSWSFDGNCPGGVFDSNIKTGASSSGACITCYANRVKFTNNIFQFTGSAGARIFWIYGDDILISGNTLKSDGGAFLTLQSGADRAMIVNNVVDVGSSTSTNLNISGNHATLSNNTIRGGNQGVRVYSDNCLLVNNRSRDTVYQQIHIASGADNTRLQGNTITGTGSGFQDQGTGTVFGGLAQGMTTILDVNVLDLGASNVRQGSGTPEGSVTAPVGSTYHRTDGGAGTSFYVKESGTGNTGWVAK